MNNHFLEKLLDGAEVEWKTLGEVSEKIYSGGTPKTSIPEYWENGTIPWMSSGEVNFKIIYKTEKFISESGLKNSSAKFVPKNSVVIALAGQGKTRGKVARTRIELTTNQSLAALTFDKGKINSDYVYYFLESQYDKLRQISSGSGTRGGLNLQMISAYKLPIPPLPVQTEIVRILDTFTALTAELTAELNMRDKQYKHYLDSLLNFNNINGLNREGGGRPLSELGILVRGNGLQKKDFTESGVPAIHYGQIYTYYGTFARKTKSFVSPELAKKLKKVDMGDVVITNTSENIEDVGKAVVYLGKTQAVTGGHATIFKPNKEILGEYFAYFTQSKLFHRAKRKYAKGAKVIDVSATDMGKIKIPVPSLEEQKRIVAILDKFETLTHSISEGLPKEIKLRQKQYEYYRNMLLNFPKAERIEA